MQLDGVWLAAASYCVNPSLLRSPADHLAKVRAAGGADTTCSHSCSALAEFDTQSCSKKYLALGPQADARMRRQSGTHCHSR
jgi:hypothetical protein